MEHQRWLAVAAAVTLAAAGLPGHAAAQPRRLDDGLARTPPMGWNTWNKFGCNVSERLIRETADAIAASGMRDAGYRYVVIDDCWQVYRDTSGTIVADPQRFPDGIAALGGLARQRSRTGSEEARAEWSAIAGDFARWTERRTLPAPSRALEAPPGDPFGLDP